MEQLTEEQRELNKRMGDEMRRLRHGIADITLAWAALESSLAVLFANIIRDDRGSVGFAVFFAPTSLETRIALVDKALAARLETSPQRDHFTKKWQSIFNALNRLKRTRNTVAHGQISTFSMGDLRKQEVRIGPVIFDFQRVGAALAKGKPPGLSAHDLENAIAATKRAAANVARLSDALALLFRNEHEASLRKLAEIELGPPNQPPQSEGQTPQGQ